MPETSGFGPNARRPDGTTTTYSRCLQPKCDCPRSAKDCHSWSLEMGMRSSQHRTDVYVLSLPSQGNTLMPSQ